MVKSKVLKERSSRDPRIANYSIEEHDGRTVHILELATGCIDQEFATHTIFQCGVKSVLQRLAGVVPCECSECLGLLSRNEKPND